MSGLLGLALSAVLYGTAAFGELLMAYIRGGASVFVGFGLIAPGLLDFAALALALGAMVVTVVVLTRRRLTARLAAGVGLCAMSAFGWALFPTSVGPPSPTLAGLIETGSHSFATYAIAAVVVASCFVRTSVPADRSLV